MFASSSSVTSSSSALRLLTSAALCTLLVSKALALPCDSCSSDEPAKAWPSVATATGIASGTEHQQCTPNFQGAPVLVSASSDDNDHEYNGSGSDSDSDDGAHWCIRGDQEPMPGAVLEIANGSLTSFRIEQTGQPDNSYIIKLGGVGNNSLILSPNADGQVALCDISQSSTAKFIISCTECMQPGESQPKAHDVLGRSCTIMDLSGQRYLGAADDNGKLMMKAYDQQQQSSSASPSGQHWRRCSQANKRDSSHVDCYGGSSSGDDDKPGMFDIVVANVESY